MGRIGLRGFESPSHQTRVSSNVPKRFLSPTLSRYGVKDCAASKLAPATN